MLSRQNIGVIAIFLSLIITLNLFILSKSDITVVERNPLLSFSQILSLLGATLLSVAFILSSRIRALERWFGGLDRAYKIHHMVAGTAFVFLVNHPLLLMVNQIPNTKAVLLYLLPGTNLSYDMGIFALWTMILLVVLTLYVKLPYHIWKKTHEFMGLVLFLGMIHVFLIPSDVASFMPLRVWMLSLMSFAMASFIYVRFLYRWFGPRYDYVIERTNRIGDIIELYLKPVKKPMEFVPGQFAFMQVKAGGIPKELHAFSFSSDEGSDLLRFSIKILGDFTLTLRELQAGKKITLWGSYGGFPAKFFSNKDAVCIAGGIGVTPFLSMLSSEAKRERRDRNIFFFYSAKNADELYYHNEISHIASTSSRIHYFPHLSAVRGRLNAKTIYDIVGDLRNKLIFLCGPYSMMHDLQKQFVGMGVKSSNIIFEDFSFK